MTMVTNQPRAAAQDKGLLTHLQVGTHVYFPDGGSVARWHRFDMTGQPGRAFEMYTTETLCVFGTDPKRHPTGYGWQITVTPVKELGDTLVFRVDWTRTRDRGRVTDAPKGSVELALRPGKSVPLDYIVPGSTESAPQPCSAVGMLLQVDLRQ
jgi:hypothetical protein